MSSRLLGSPQEKDVRFPHHPPKRQAARGHLCPPLAGVLPRSSATIYSFVFLCWAFAGVVAHPWFGLPAEEWRGVQVFALEWVCGVLFTIVRSSGTSPNRANDRRKDCGNGHSFYVLLIYLFFLLWVHECMFTWAGISAWMGVHALFVWICMFVWERACACRCLKLTLVSSLIALHFIDWGEVSPWSQSSPILTYLACKLTLRIPFLPLVCRDYKMPPCLLGFMWVLGIQILALVLSSIIWTISSYDRHSFEPSDWGWAHISRYSLSH